MDDPNLTGAQIDHNATANADMTLNVNGTAGIMAAYNSAGSCTSPQVSIYFRRKLPTS